MHEWKQRLQKCDLSSGFLFRNRGCIKLYLKYAQRYSRILRSSFLFWDKTLLKCCLFSNCWLQFLFKLSARKTVLKALECRIIVVIVVVVATVLVVFMSKLCVSPRRCQCDILSLVAFHILLGCGICSTAKQNDPYTRIFYSPALASLAFCQNDEKRPAHGMWHQESIRTRTSNRVKKVRCVSIHPFRTPSHILRTQRHHAAECAMQRATHAARFSFLLLLLLRDGWFDTRHTLHTHAPHSIRFDVVDDLYIVYTSITKRLKFLLK